MAHPRHAANKDAAGLLAPFAAIADGLIAVPVPDHDHHAPDALAETARQIGITNVSTAPDVAAALRLVATTIGADDEPPVVLILGSLYLAGAVLRGERRMARLTYCY